MRILIIANNAISQFNNNGKTVYSFLKDIPPENIAQLYFGTNEIPFLEGCKNYYRVTEIDVLRSIVTLKFSTKNTHGQLISQIDTSIPNKKKDGKILNFLKKHSSTLAIFREQLWQLNTWYSKELNEWIQQFEPTVIFAVLGDCIFTHKIALKLAKRYNIPLSVYFTDDYVLDDLSSNIFQKIHYHNLKKIYVKSIAFAKKSFVIGEKMQKAYRDYFKHDFGILVNGIDIEIFKKFNINKIVNNKPIIISYIGGLHLNRWKTIIRLAQIINQQNEFNIEFKVFSVAIPDDSILQAFSRVGVSYCGSLNYEGVLKQMENSHFLLHIESFDEKDRLYTRYSISTKIPEYMMSKRGIIAFGPSDIASIEIFKDNNLGCVFTEMDTDEEIKNKVNQFIRLYNQYDFARQYEYALKHFDQQKMLLSNIL